MTKAMYFCFIVLLIVAQTRVYTNTDNFFLFCFCFYTVKEQVGNSSHQWQSGEGWGGGGGEFKCLKGGGTTDGRAVAGGYTSTRRMRQETGVHKNEQVARKQRERGG